MRPVSETESLSIHLTHTHRYIYIYCIYIYQYHQYLNVGNTWEHKLGVEEHWFCLTVLQQPVLQKLNMQPWNQNLRIFVLSSRSPMKLSPTSRGVSCTNRTCHFHTGLNTFPVFAKGIKTANQISIHPILPHKVGNTSGYAMRIRCVPARIMQP
jgi:hypothetical protein